MKKGTHLSIMEPSDGVGRPPRRRIIDGYAKESLKLHYRLRGKLETVPKLPVANKDDLSLAYTPGVAAPPRNRKGPGQRL